MFELLENIKKLGLSGIFGSRAPAQAVVTKLAGPDLQQVPLEQLKEIVMSIEAGRALRALFSQIEEGGWSLIKKGGQRSYAQVFSTVGKRVALQSTDQENPHRLDVIENKFSAINAADESGRGWLTACIEESGFSVARSVKGRKTEFLLRLPQDASGRDVTYYQWGTEMVQDGDFLATYKTMLHMIISGTVPPGFEKTR